MKVFLIIGGALLVLSFLRRWFKKSINPIKTIKFNGCLGFRLGDKKEFVFSRISHLKLMNAEEKEHHQLMTECGLSDLRSYVNTSYGLFNNIEGISFHFNPDVLCSIMINIKPTQLDRSSMVDMLISKLTSRLGNSMHTFDSVTTWQNGPYIVSITNDLNDDNPYIYVADRRLNRM